MIKKNIVEHDEKETGERKLLNFGHSYGHAFESSFGMNGYYHGECVGLGMLAVMENPQLIERTEKVLKRLSLPTECQYDPEEIISLMKSDKKSNHDTITIVQVDEIGHGYLQEWTYEKAGKKIGL